MALLVISSSPWQFRPPSPPPQLCPRPDPPPCGLPLRRWKLSPPEPPLEAPSPPDLPLEALSPPEPPLESLSPPKPPFEALSPPEPPDPPDASFDLVSLLLLDKSCAFSQLVSKSPDLESFLLNMALVFCDGVSSLVYVGNTSFVSMCWYPVVCSVVLCWCVNWSSYRSFPGSSIMLVIVLGDSTMGCSILITIFLSIPHPLTQVLSLRFPDLMLSDELISLIQYLGLSHGLSLSLALVRPFTAVCSFFTVLCSFTFVVFKSFCAHLWQFDGLLLHISIYLMNWTLLDVYSRVSSVMEFVLLPNSSSTLCGFGAGNVLLKIRDTSNFEVLIKGFVAMLKIVDCALTAASISGIISLIVVSIFQGFVSLYSLMVIEIRGLLDVISCSSVLYAPILLCCICFLVIAVCLAGMALFTCFMNTFSFHGE